MVEEAYKASPKGSYKRDFFEGMKEGMESQLLASEIGYHFGRRMREKHQDSLIIEIPVYTDIYKVFSKGSFKDFANMSISEIEDVFERVLAA